MATLDSIPEIPLKQCTRKERCINPLGSWLPATLEHFGKFRKGLRPECTVCKRAEARAYSDTHREQRREYGQRYRQENVLKEKERHRVYRQENRAAINERDRAYYQAHIEEEHSRGRYYRLRHRKQRQVYEKNYLRAHLVEHRAKAHRRRARLRGNGGTHTAADIALQLKTQTDKRGSLLCWWCGRQIIGSFHIDHRIPLAKGGNNAPENICIACPKCNLSKHDKLPQEWNGRLL